MKKIALVFVLAVFVPSLVLAWLAVRSLRDQQFLLERQQSLLYQGTADGMVKDLVAALTDAQHGFTIKVDSILRDHNPRELAPAFDTLLRQAWPLAEVGFVVTMSGEILSPSMLAGADAKTFLAENSRFLANLQSAEVYSNMRQSLNNPVTLAQNDSTYARNDNSLAGRKGTDSQKAEKRYVVPQ